MAVVAKPAVKGGFRSLLDHDYSRLAYAEVLPDERATTAIAFLSRAIDYYRRHVFAAGRAGAEVADAEGSAGDGVEA